MSDYKGLCQVVPERRDSDLPLRRLKRVKKLFSFFLFMRVKIAGFLNLLDSKAILFLLQCSALNLPQESTGYA
ncbi:hypothetical protein [Rhizobium sp. 2MFCol3.1]|jgi:hypothetical protein|uniref:hypothetical protein n=1 Tax=Rhizobium sp. 2MFCol3.1 TaxID=1246459 RepID=UPI00047816D9|nr:hypothetical protein [Rhizobium sp. 2MFCol3.1]